MLPFQTEEDGGQRGNYKRKAEADYSSRKRLALEGGGPGSSSRTPHSERSTDSEEQFWMVQWRNHQYKKHKTWDGDAVLIVNGTRARLVDLEGKLVTVGSAELPVQEGSSFSVGGKDIEVERSVLRADYFSGSCFGRAGPSAPVPLPTKTGLSKHFVPLTRKPLPVANGNSSSVGPSGVHDKKVVPLQPVDLISENTQSVTKSDSGKVEAEDSHWTANWRKQQHRKHKTWDGDAYISHRGNKITMISEDGKILGSTAWKGDLLYSGYTIYIAGKELQLDNKVSESQLPDIIGTSAGFSNDVASGSLGRIPLKTSVPPQANAADDVGTLGSLGTTNPTTSSAFVAPMSFYGPPAKSKPKGPLHNPEAEGAVVMRAPTKEHMAKFNKKSLPVVPVVLDPILARRMRPHQQEGIKFLYECVMGLRKHEGQGCILADEMGLGKTLQTISLVWTLLKQNPYAGTGPVIAKALVVCPVSLVENWRAEFHKWLGRDRVGVLAIGKDKKHYKEFLNSKVHNVLVIGYERLRTIIEELAYCNPPIGLIICDEGHRLKSAKNQTTAMFKALRTRRRIILSGTPVQNDLSEFHAMADFCNPGLLDDYNTFRRVYEIPILKSRAPDCSTKETELGEARSAQLLTIGKSFVLRREASILENYLPPKHEYVVFVTPTALQLSIFSKILHPDKLDNLMHGSTAESLALINLLTKISNSPILLKATAENAKNKGSDVIKRTSVEEALKLLPENAQIDDLSLSGKLAAVSKLLRIIRENTEEKCVLVSHYTSTLNILEAFCKKKSYTYFRLDGQTPVAKRQEYVNIFNKSSQRSRFLFLLSSKAGGVGLNLIGASRLCLIDSDWNPSHDLQAMARIHRDGQKRPVFIYRFLTAGTIDEKIYQRQVTKLGLTNSLMGSGNSGSKSDSFSKKDLRDIFRIHPNTACNTHDLLECPCDGSTMAGVLKVDDDLGSDSDIDDSQSEKGFIAASQVVIQKMDKVYLKKKKAELASLGEWTHINCLSSTARDDIQDDILRKLVYTEKAEAKQEPAIDHKTRLDSLLSAVDLGNLPAFDEDGPKLLSRDVPGGTMSFLFGRSSKSTLAVTSDFDES